MTSGSVLKLPKIAQPTVSSRCLLILTLHLQTEDTVHSHKKIAEEKSLLCTVHLGQNTLNTKGETKMHVTNAYLTFSVGVISNLVFKILFNDCQTFCLMLVLRIW